MKKETDLWRRGEGRKKGVGGGVTFQNWKTAIV